MKAEHERYLGGGKVPLGAQRVKVLDAQGKQRWRHIPGVVGANEGCRLQDDDQILLTERGLPVFMKGDVGRKKVTPLPKREPKTPQAKVVVRDKKKHMAGDPLLKAIHKNPEATDVLYATMRAIAIEASSLEFERNEAELQNKDTVMISNRRLNALTKIGDTWLRRYEQLTTKGLDLDGAAFKAVYGLIVETFRSVLIEREMTGDEVKLVLTLLGQKVSADSWMVEAKNRIRQQQ